MNLDLIAEVWDVLNYHIDVTERSNAATSLVDFLIDNNFNSDDIKHSFSGDKQILKALEAYDDEVEYDDDSYEDDYEDDEDEWE